MTDPSADGIINMEIIESLRELGGEEDPGLVVELIDLYLADAPERIREIQAALACDDFDLLERASHTLKSASANIGALQLSSLCAELESMGRSREVLDSQAHSECSAESFAEVEEALLNIKG